LGSWISAAGFNVGLRKPGKGCPGSVSEKTSLIQRLVFLFLLFTFVFLTALSCKIKCLAQQLVNDIKSGFQRLTVNEKRL
jgi:hypothetical protein